MKTTERFEKAWRKLYTAFHNGTLNAFDCRACAVGNIVDNTRSWQNYYGHSMKSCGPITFYKDFSSKNSMDSTKNCGYLPIHLHKVEKIFLTSFTGLHSGKNKDAQFKGLCAVIEYLAELDGIDDFKNFTKLFEYDTETDLPKYELTH